jgi:hypothetical protein
MPKSRKRIVVGVVALVLGLTACHSEPTPPPQSPTPTAQPAWPEKLNDFRFRWSADSGFDLDSGWAVPLRAYLESWRVMLYTDDLDAGYPGFKRAAPVLLQEYSPEWSKAPAAQHYIGGYRDKNLYGDPNQRLVGNEDLHILKVEPIASGFRAFVCDSTFHLYEQQDGASTFSPLNLQLSTSKGDADFHNMKVWRTEFSDRDPRAGTTPPVSPTRPQFGPLPAPRNDVFGPWFVTGSDEVVFWSDTDFPGLTPGSPEARQHDREAMDAEEAMRQQCLAQYPLNAEQRKAIATTVVDKPPTVEPALPGWPE